jgi:DNA-binding transcriptional regulator/RsmH inhibitor MraZ
VVDPQTQVNPARPPLGIYSSRCDEKGRVRLPKEFEEYAKTFPEQQFFVTSLDGDIGRIYPIHVWRENLKILAEYSADPQAADDLAYIADTWGSVSGLDAQGRILVPPALRRKLEIEEQKVNLRFYNGAIDLYSEAAHEKRLQRATASAAAALPALRKAGLK